MSGADPTTACLGRIRALNEGADQGAGGAPHGGEKCAQPQRKQRPPYPPGKRPGDLQVECLIVFWSPVVALGLGGEFPLLVTLVWPNHGDLHEGAKHAGGLPL